MSTIDFNNQLMSHNKQLKYFAMQLTADYEAAQDLLQETYLKAIKYQHGYAEDTNLRAWLYTIMKNLFINEYRKAIKMRSVVDQGKDLNYVHVAPGASPRQAESHLREQEIYKAIEALDEEYKLPFEMYVEGYKYKEIAEHFNAPIGTIKSRIFLARKELMKVLEDTKR